MSYKLKQEIENKLFNGIVVPTAVAQGYDMSNQNEIVNMMEAMCKKYHSLNTEQRVVLIKKAEQSIEDQINKLSGDKNDTN